MSAAPSQDARADWDKICCPICAGTSFEHLFEKAGEPFVRCLECRLTLINPRPPFSAIRAGYDAGLQCYLHEKSRQEIAPRAPSRTPVTAQIRSRLALAGRRLLRRLRGPRGAGCGLRCARRRY